MEFLVFHFVFVVLSVHLSIHLLGAYQNQLNSAITVIYSVALFQECCWKN